VSGWWQRRSRRLWLALGYAVAGDAALGLCATGLAGLGIWKPQGVQDALAALVISGAVVTLLLIAAGYVLAGVALEPVRETIELARRLSGQPGGRQIPVTNPHDELGELEIFLNELLQRLEGSFVELDRFAADVSHELRTPLTAMRSVGEVALRERNPAILYDAVGSMLEEVRRMNQLIDRLLLLTRGDSDKWPVRPKAGPVRVVLMEVSELPAMSNVAVGLICTRLKSDGAPEAGNGLPGILGIEPMEVPHAAEIVLPGGHVLRPLAQSRHGQRHGRYPRLDHGRGHRDGHRHQFG